MTSLQSSFICYLNDIINDINHDPEKGRLSSYLLCCLKTSSLCRYGSALRKEESRHLAQIRSHL